MELKGRRIIALGDSITEGVGTSAPDRAYPAVLARLTGAEVLNYGVGGTRYAPVSDEINPAWAEDFIRRVDRLPEWADLILVFGGTNDFGHGGLPLGTFADRTPDTFYGACHTLYTRLIRKYPASRIVILTPLHRLSENDTVNERGQVRAPLASYVRAEGEVAAHYALPVIDLYREGGMQPAVEEWRVRYMPDGLHPNDAGAERLAAFIAARLASF